MRRAGPLAAATAVALVLMALHARTHQGEVLAALADESLLVPLAQRHADPAAFAGDRWLDLAAQIFSVPYSMLLAPFLGWLDDPVHALRVLSLPFLVVYLAFSWRVAGPRGGWALVLLAVIPPFEQALGPGQALPRDLVFALVPVFWLAVRAARERDGLAWWLAAFAALGLAANLHPLTALHLAALLLLASVRRETFAADVRRGGACVAAFVVGALPYVVQYLTRPSAPGGVPEAVLEWRVGAIGAETLSTWAGRMEPVLWALGAVLALGRVRRGEADEDERRWMHAAWIAVALAAVGPFAARFVEPLRPFQLDRFARFALWLLALVAARRALGAGRFGWEPRRLVGFAAAAGCMILAGPAGKRVFTSHARAPKRGLLHDVARKIDVRLMATPPYPAAPQGVNRRHGGDPTRHLLEGSLEGFVDVAAWAREHSRPGEVFLVPPEFWGAFRAYARRPIAITRKDGGYALTFLGGVGEEWLEEYGQTVAAYAGRGPWEPVVERSGARYVVVEPWVAPPGGWARVYTAGPYAVFRRPDRGK